MRLSLRRKLLGHLSSKNFERWAYQFKNSRRRGATTSLYALTRLPIYLRLVKSGHRTRAGRVRLLKN